MKEKYMKILKPCFGDKTQFFKEKEEECKTCQFKFKCLLKIKRMLYKDE